MDKGISASFHARLKHGPCKTGTGTSASFHARLKQGPCKMGTGTSASFHARLKHGSYKMDTGTSALQKQNDKENNLVYLFSQYKLNQINEISSSKMLPYQQKYPWRVRCGWECSCSRPVSAIKGHHQYCYWNTPFRMCGREGKLPQSPHAYNRFLKSSLTTMLSGEDKARAERN